MAAARARANENLGALPELPCLMGYAANPAPPRASMEAMLDWMQLPEWEQAEKHDAGESLQLQMRCIEHELFTRWDLKDVGAPTIAAVTVQCYIYLSVGKCSIQDKALPLTDHVSVQ